LKRVPRIPVSLPALVALLALALPAPGASTQVLLSEVLGSWQGDDDVQFVELVVAGAGGSDVAGASLTFTAAAGERQSFQLPVAVANGDPGRRILVATARAVDVTGLAADVRLPAGLLPARIGRVCYQVPDGEGGTITVDCLAYGGFAGSNGPFGAPLGIGPDNRSLERVQGTGTNRDDWVGRLRPTPANNADATVTLDTLCGSGSVDAGEECDGDDRRGATCRSLGFARGTLACTQCHLDASGCIACGNGVINGREACDGGDLGGHACTTLGFTGGTLACTPRCRFDTAGCDPTFFVPGGGAARPDCLAAWQVTNAAQRPGGSGRARVRQRCRDGDPGCDGDTTPGQCTISVAACLGRVDARLPGCRPRPIARWTLTRSGSPALAAAVAQLGPSSVADGSVEFAPPLDGARCTDVVPIVVPVRRTLTLKTRTVPAAGGPADLDTLRLVCVP
jgi:hypothetical protein